jgi:hypothetical protein
MLAAMMRLVAAAGLVLAVGAMACQAVRDDMTRAQRSYEAARYERTRVWLQDLEADVPDMDRPLRARFFYLRGMTAYRLGHRNEALHYLALAREEARDREGLLGPKWRKSMNRTLEELVPKGASHKARKSESPNE